MKVKKFRLHPRLPTVKKNLKTILGQKVIPTEVEETLPHLSEEFVSKVVPVAFYQTWSSDDMPDAFRASLEEHKLTKALSVSVLVATIGSSPEEEISEALMSGESMRSNVLAAVGEECADLSFNFLHKLLVGDAKQDDCEVAEAIRMKEGPLLTEMLTNVSADQEGVFVDSAGHLSPRFTRVALIAWLPVSKRKKQNPLAKKR